MDVIILAIALLAIAGPTILALVLYRRNNPDRRSSVDTVPLTSAPSTTGARQHEW